MYLGNNNSWFIGSSNRARSKEKRRAISSAVQRDMGANTVVKEVMITVDIKHKTPFLF